MPFAQRALARCLRQIAVAPKAQPHQLHPSIPKQGVQVRGIAESKRQSTAVGFNGVTSKYHRDAAAYIPRDFRDQDSLHSQLYPLTPHPRDTGTPFNTLLNDLTATLTTNPTPSLSILFHHLQSYVSNPAEWAPFAHFNPQKQYTRNLVCEVPGLFNLLLLVWTPGKESPVHDHADSHCLMKVLKGEIRETRYETPKVPGSEGRLREIGNRAFGLNKITYMADELGLHKIENPHPSEYAVSLHLYTPPNAAMRGCHVYEVENGESKHVMQGPYDTVGGVGSVH